MVMPGRRIFRKRGARRWRWALGLLILPLAVAVWAQFFSPGALFETPFGELWSAIHRDSLLLLEPGITRHIHPALWDHGMLPLLLAPAVLVAAIPAALAAVRALFQ